MKVALIDPSLFTLPYDQALATGLRQRGHSVSLHGRRLRPEERIGQPLPQGNFYPLAETALARRAPAAARLALKGMEHMLGMASLLRRLRRDPPDVIHCQWLALPMLDRAYLGPLAALAPLVLTVHDTNPFNGNPSARLQAMGFYAALRRFDAMIVHTQQGQARLRAAMPGHSAITVVPHGLLAPVVPPDAATPNTITFLMFGKMKPYKGIDVLIAAFARLPSALRVRARLRVVGQPEMDLAPLRTLAERLGVAHHLLLEPRHVPQAEVASLFGADTVAVFPYREIEASGVLALAIAHGRPVLASRLGGFTEAIAEGVNGRLFAPDDTGALAALLGELIEHPAHLARYAAAMHRTARATPGWDVIAERTVAVYRAAARGRATQATSIEEGASCPATP